MAQVPVREGLFTLDGGRLRLRGGYSRSSGRYHFPLSPLSPLSPLAPVCPYTGADDVEEVTLSDRGTLWAWTAVTAPPPGYRGEAPYGFGVVELEEGLRVVGRLTEADPDRLHEGRPMRLVAETLFADDDGNDVVTWAFEPEPEGRGPDDG